MGWGAWRYLVSYRLFQETFLESPRIGRKALNTAHHTHSIMNKLLLDIDVASGEVCVRFSEKLNTLDLGEETRQSLKRSLLVLLPVAQVSLS